MFQRLRPRKRRPDFQPLREEIRKTLNLIKRLGGGKHVTKTGDRLLKKRGLPQPFSLDKIPAKQPYDGCFYQHDCPIFNLETFYGALKLTKGVIMVFPDGCVKARVRIPEDLRKYFVVHPHTRSTLARVGIEVELDQYEFQRMLSSCPLPEDIIISIINWGNHPCLLREDDNISLANTSLSLTLPGINPHSFPQTSSYGLATDLHAGDRRIKIIKKKLPLISLPKMGEVAYIDPRHPDLKNFTHSEKFERLELEAGEFVVMSVKENLQIPEGHIGVVHSAVDRLQHTTATLVYPLWEGELTLEFKVWRKMTIIPGMLVAYLSCHRPQNPLETYHGRYQKQHSIQPKQTLTKGCPGCLY